MTRPNWPIDVNEHPLFVRNRGIMARLRFRLGLERSKNALEALTVITDLLEQFGQGGPCSDIIPDFSYHNAFLIADHQEAWILETADRFWVAENVKSMMCPWLFQCLLFRKTHFQAGFAISQIA